MSTAPEPKPPAESRKRQTTYLVGAAVIIASVIAALALFDRSGAERQENEGRSNEEQKEKPGAVNPAASSQ